MDKKMLDSPENYYNRELSWLKFNYRILDEARDKTIPLFERLRFLAITESNLSEFFMVRVASLVDLMDAGITKKDIAGMTPEEQLAHIIPETKKMCKQQYQTLNRSLLPAMEAEGLVLLLHHEDLDERQAKYVDKYFDKEVYPVLTPMAVDSSRPFPLISNRSLNIGALITDKKNPEVTDIATVQVPSVLPRVVELPERDGKRYIILLEEVIKRNLFKLFLTYNIKCAHAFRIIRNADLSIDEDEAADLLKEIEKQIKRRAWGEVIKLEVDADINKKLLKELKERLSVVDGAIFAIHGPLDLTFLSKVAGLDGFDHLQNKKYTPQPVPGIDPTKSLFDQIKEKDILLHHPYYEFTPVVDFIREAANDPNVLAIKQTLYRVSGNSPIVAALARAAENGKQVTVLVELKARFDEENNINWARKLEKAGCHVIYGLVGLKTHSKIALVVRREEEGIKRYVHLGTGNYNDITAKLYTDTGIFTAADSIGEDATAVFNMLSGYSEPPVWNKLLVAPLWMKKKFLYLIGRETANARDGKEARIVAKMNSLCDPDIIKALYEASSSGVKIDLIVRGICCLKVGVPGLSENITVRSIVGNFLEHARIFYFYNEGFEDVYMGSADWMPRNLDKRVEITFPVEDENLKKRVIEILRIQQADTLKVHLMQPDGSYAKLDQRGKEKLSAQEYFCKQAIAETKKEEKVSQGRVFIPRTAAD